MPPLGLSGLVLPQEAPSVSRSSPGSPPRWGPVPIPTEPSLTLPTLSGYYKPSGRTLTFKPLGKLYLPLTCKHRLFNATSSGSSFGVAVSATHVTQITHPCHP